MKQRRQFLEEVRLSELLRYRWGLTEQPKEPTKQSKAPETSTTLVDCSDSEWVAEGHLPLQETPSSVWPEGHLDMEEPLSGWPWAPFGHGRHAQGPGAVPQQEVGHHGPPCSIHLDV